MVDSKINRKRYPACRRRVRQTEMNLLAKIIRNSDIRDGQRDALVTDIIREFSRRDQFFDAVRFRVHSKPQLPEGWPK